jgi:hypothetical protein
MSKAWWIGLLTATALVGIAAGCQTNSPAQHVHGEVFPPEGETRDVQNIAIAQAAAGARADATLHAADFDGSSLNSLGQQKLDLMLADEMPADPMALYLDLPQTTASGPAHDSVMAYLKGRGLDQTQIQIEDGPNPRSTGSAAESISGITALRTAGQAVPVQATDSAAAANTPPTYPAPGH